MDAASFLPYLASEGASLAGAAEGHLDRPVPTCPGWDMAQLVRHVGDVHSWVRRVVAAGGESVGPRRASTAPEDPAVLLAWYRDGLAELVTALSIDPETPAWTFSPASPATVGWWRRRQAMETAVHRWDAQDAAGLPADVVAAELATEGIDEVLTDFVPRALAGPGAPLLTGTLHLHATDTPGEWWLDFGGDVLVTRREHAKADAALRGPASGLYLWLWNRQTAAVAGLEVFGRTETVDAWSAMAF
jgi:uncharacterized protein (TIGR03083 family)